MKLTPDTPNHKAHHLHHSHSQSHQSAAAPAKWYASISNALSSWYSALYGCDDNCLNAPFTQRVLRWCCGVLLAVSLLSGWAYSLVLTNRCSMDQNLHELLMFSTEQLTNAKIPFWLEFGTLLGAVRDHSIVPWEYDVDLAVSESDCERVLSLRSAFKELKGWNMYGRGEFIPEKSSLFGLIGGTISAPCVRVYHANAAYPLDIYWARTVTHNPPTHTTPDGAPYIPPPERTGELDVAEADANQILCDYEAFPEGGDWNDHHSACRWRSDMFPLATATMYGRTFPVPRHARKILTQTFGPDWMTPRPKGYKAVLCPPVWHTGSGTIYAVVCVGVAALGLSLFVYQRYLSAMALANGIPASSGGVCGDGIAHGQPMGGGGSAAAMAAARALAKEHTDHDTPDDRIALTAADLI